MESSLAQFMSAYEELNASGHFPPIAYTEPDYSSPQKTHVYLDIDGNDRYDEGFDEDEVDLLVDFFAQAGLTVEFTSAAASAVGLPYLTVVPN